MNADRLLAHYERIADAPDAISTPAPVHPRFGRARQAGGAGSRTDEPASAAVEADCGKEKARLVKAGKIKETKARILDEPTGSSDVPFDVPPSNWAMEPPRKTLTC